MSYPHSLQKAIKNATFTLLDVPAHGLPTLSGDLNSTLIPPQNGRRLWTNPFSSLGLNFPMLQMMTALQIFSDYVFQGHKSERAFQTCLWSHRNLTKSREVSKRTKLADRQVTGSEGTNVATSKVMWATMKANESLRCSYVPCQLFESSSLLVLVNGHREDSPGLVSVPTLLQLEVNNSLLKCLRLLPIFCFAITWDTPMTTSGAPHCMSRNKDSTSIYRKPCRYQAPGQRLLICYKIPILYRMKWRLCMAAWFIQYHTAGKKHI